jgi:hypothetical protein
MRGEDMFKGAPRRIIVSLGVLGLFAAAAVVLAAASSAAPKTVPLHGHMLDVANFFGPSCPSPTGVCSSFTATGSIQGEGVVSVDSLPNAEGISRAHTVITTKKGELRCNEQALFDLVGADHAFVDLCVITGGTGAYEGATGYIQEVGTFDFATNHGEIQYFGKLVYGTD